MSNGLFILNMLIYSAASSLWIGYSVEHFKKAHYYRFGMGVVGTISDLLLMAKTIFSL